MCIHVCVHVCLCVCDWKWGNEDNGDVLVCMCVCVYMRVCVIVSRGMRIMEVHLCVCV